MFKERTLIEKCLQDNAVTTNHKLKHFMTKLCITMCIFVLYVGFF